MDPSVRVAICVALFSGVVSAAAYATERAEICAKYMTSSGWSDGYKVEGTITKGLDLNRATRTFDYNAYSTYVVIFWGENEASVIEMAFPLVSVIGQRGTDQQGREWEIAKTSVCF